MSERVRFTAIIAIISVTRVCLKKKKTFDYLTAHGLYGLSKSLSLFLVNRMVIRVFEVTCESTVYVHIILSVTQGG